MKKLLNKIKPALQLLWNKGIALALVLILIFKYSGLSDAPFAELLYAVILTGSVIITAPVVRLLVFSGAAKLAESGELAKELAKTKVSPALFHYWFATLISYAVTLLCVSSLL